MIYVHNQSDYSSRIRNFITCGTISKPLKLTHNEKAIDFRIQRAPEPQDILWANIGISDLEKFKRKMITYTVTIIMLGVSFAAVYGLSLAQVNNSSNRYLSTLISLLISLINIIISRTYYLILEVIRRLSIYERDYT